MSRRAMKWLSMFLGLAAAATGFHAQTEEPRRDWIDPATGHRVVRLTDEPGGSTLYFHDNAFSPEGDKLMLQHAERHRRRRRGEDRQRDADAGHRQRRGPGRLFRPARPRDLSQRRRRQLGGGRGESSVTAVNVDTRADP